MVQYTAWRIVAKIKKIRLTKQFLIFWQHFGKSKVGDFHIKTIIQQNVFRLQISMYNWIRMNIIDAFEYLSKRSHKTKRPKLENKCLGNVVENKCNSHDVITLTA